jgi:hypothetical protein
MRPRRFQPANQPEEKMATRNEVTLYNLCGCGLIILMQSGVYYTNQAAGHYCAQPIEEGILIPFERVSHDRELEKSLRAILENCTTLTDELANRVDDVLSSFHETRCAKVDRSRLVNSMEAWVYVDNNDEHDDDHEFPLFCGFGICRGVLTWENSD